jgi:YidC/Oxa1 family membrane protein insertase
LTDNRNMIFAIALSALVLIGWTLFSDRFLPTPPTSAPTVAAAPAGTPASSAPMVPGVTPAIPVPGSTTGPLRPAELVVRDSPRIAIDTPRLAGTINLKGARIDDLVFKTYRETIRRDAPAVRLFAPSGSPRAYFAQFGWTGAGAPAADALWSGSGTLTPRTPVVLTTTGPTGAVFEIKLSVDDQWLFTAEQSVRNTGATPLTVQPFGLVSHTGEGLEPATFQLHNGPIGTYNDRLVDTDVTYEKLREAGQIAATTTGGWLGIGEKYWLAALIPDQAKPQAFRFASTTGDRFQTDFLGGPVAVAPGATAATRSRLFAGAKEVEALNKYRDDLGVPLFDRAIDWGWFRVIAQPIYVVLHWLFTLTGNFGVAIIGLTLIIRTLMFPLANKQYASMAKMRIVAPRLKELQAKHKDDKPKLQQEMMALYAKEKVNPVAGCLPILVQIPVFYALYKTLLISTEMRHQPFVLWIRDLSAPDPVTPLNLFGLIPWQPPAMIALGILPILLGITMWLQQKMNPTPMDPVQKQVFAIMPWIFMFIMAPFAAGLQLYWTINNLVSILQQWLMLRKYPMPAEPAAPAVVSLTKT